MSDKYKITGEEINQILMHSPYALSLTPSERGMSGEQIKRFFYDFIKVFADKLNLHLGDVGNGVDRVERELSEMVEGKLSEHNGGTDAHGDMRQTIEGLADSIERANGEIADAYELAEASYSLASGKTRVHIEMSFGTVFGTLEYENVNVGDLIMVMEKGCPDFVVASGEYKSAALKITKDMVTTGKLPTPEVGGLYYYEPCDKTLIAIESGIDASIFATKEYVDSLNISGGKTGGKYELIEAITVGEEAKVERKYPTRYKKIILMAVCDGKLPKFTLTGDTWFSEFYGFSNYAKTRAVYIGEIIVPGLLSESRCLTGDAGGNPTEYHTITGRLFGGPYFDGFKSDSVCYAGTIIKVFGVKNDEN